MVNYDIDLYRNEYSEEVIFLIIQKLIKKDYDEYPLRLKRYLIVYLVKYIDTERLLHSTLDLLEDFEFISEREIFENQIKEGLINQDYTYNDIIKLIAICSSEAMYYTLKTNEYGNPKDIPQLELNFKDRIVESNIDEVDNFLKRMVFLKVVERSESLPPIEREMELKNIISTLAKLDYEAGSNFFKEERKLFKVLKENLRENTFSLESKKALNPFPDVFKGVYNTNFLIFEDYKAKFILDPFLDYSFLYQQLLFDDLIFPIKHKNFMQWLRENNFIKEKVYSMMLEKGGFQSLRKSSSNYRLNNYFITKDGILSVPQS